MAPGRWGCLVLISVQTDQLGNYALVFLPVPLFMNVRDSRQLKSNPHEMNTPPRLSFHLVGFLRKKAETLQTYRPSGPDRTIRSEVLGRYLTLMLRPPAGCYCVGAGFLLFGRQVCELRFKNN